MSRSGTLLAGLLLLGISWLLWPRSWADGGVALEPRHVRLQGGQVLDLQLLNREPTIVAMSFRLRFDERVVAVTAAMPAHPSIVDGGEAINLPVQRQPGQVEIPGTAMTGGQIFTATAPIYRFTIRGVGPGTTVVAVEDVTVVDLGFEVRSLAGAAAEVTVYDPPQQ